MRHVIYIIDGVHTLLTITARVVLDTMHLPFSNTFRPLSRFVGSLRLWE